MPPTSRTWLPFMITSFPEMWSPVQAKDDQASLSRRHERSRQLGVFTSPSAGCPSLWVNRIQEPVRLGESSCTCLEEKYFLHQNNPLLPSLGLGSGSQGGGHVFTGHPCIPSRALCLYNELSTVTRFRRALNFLAVICISLELQRLEQVNMCYQHNELSA